MNRLLIPFTDGAARDLRAGEHCLLSGVIYSARDQAHARLVQMMEAGEALPLELENQVIYYMGPAPTPEGAVIGSCGPTTSSRMDPFTPRILSAGVKGVIGKGPRSPEVGEALKREGAVYFYSFGGCGALYAGKIRAMSLIAFPDLGPEAIYRLDIEDFPVIVGIDSFGGSVF